MESKSFVEGDWNNFEFRMIQESDHRRVLKFLHEHYFEDEPLCKLLGLDEDLTSDYESYAEEVLKENQLHFLAMDKATNKIAAVRLFAVIEKSKTSESLNPTKFKSEKMHEMAILGKDLVERANVFERFPDITNYVKFVLVCVAKEHRGQGLASEIYKRTEKMLIALGFPLVRCIFTSPYTEKIARKMGWLELSKVVLKDFKNEEGIKYFSKAEEGQQAVFMVKELTNA